MANTYTQIYIQIVFAVARRQCLLPPQHRHLLFKYIGGIIKKRGQKPIAINGVSDHVHVLVGMTPEIAISDLVRDIKAGSSGFINEQGWIRGKFNWQEGFGAFSYSRSQIGEVAEYIEQQEKHHAKARFKREYLKMLDVFGVHYDRQYILKGKEELDSQ